LYLKLRYQVILTGGSANITKITTTISSYFEGAEIKKDVYADETAVAGAAIEAALLISDDDIDEATLFTEVDTLPVSLSIAGADGKAIFLVRTHKKKIFFYSITFSRIGQGRSTHPRQARTKIHARQGPDQGPGHRLHWRQGRG